jgi:hypothetical protein
MRKEDTRAGRLGKDNLDSCEDGVKCLIAERCMCRLYISSDMWVQEPGWPQMCLIWSSQAIQHILPSTFALSSHPSIRALGRRLKPKIEKATSRSRYHRLEAWCLAVLHYASSTSRKCQNAGIHAQAWLERLAYKQGPGCYKTHIKSWLERERQGQLRSGQRCAVRRLRAGNLGVNSATYRHLQTMPKKGSKMELFFGGNRNW